MKIGIDKYMYFVYFCIVQNKQNQNQNENLRIANQRKGDKKQKHYQNGSTQ